MLRNNIIYLKLAGATTREYINFIIDKFSFINIIINIIIDRFSFINIIINIIIESSKAIIIIN